MTTIEEDKQKAEKVNSEQKFRRDATIAIARAFSASGLTFSEVTEFIELTREEPKNTKRS